MKKLLGTFMVCLLTLSSTIATAQVNLVARNAKPEAGLSDPASEGVNTATSSRVDAATVNERVVKNFTKHFANTTNAAWTKTSNGFMVLFASDGIQNRVYLTKRGNLQGRIRYYTENELPAAVRHEVKSRYYDFAITSVKEVYDGRTTAYLVTVADETTWKVIRVVDGETDVLEAYVKG